MEALEEFRNLFIQLETSESAHEYSKNNRASYTTCCLATSGTNSNTAGSVLRFNRKQEENCYILSLIQMAAISTELSERCQMKKLGDKPNQPAKTRKNQERMI